MSQTVEKVAPTVVKDKPETAHQDAASMKSGVHQGELKATKGAEVFEVDLSTYVPGSPEEKALVRKVGFVAFLTD